MALARMGATHRCTIVLATKHEEWNYSALYEELEKMGYRISIFALETDLHAFVGQHFSQFTQWIKESLEDPEPTDCMPEFLDFIFAHKGQWPHLEKLKNEVAPEVVDEVMFEFIGCFIDTHPSLQPKQIGGSIYFKRYETLFHILESHLSPMSRACMQYLLNGRRLTQPEAYFSPVTEDIFKVAFWLPTECESLYTELQCLPPGSPPWQNAVLDRYQESTEPKWAYQIIMEALSERLKHEHLLLTAA